LATAAAAPAWGQAVIGIAKLTSKSAEFQALTGMRTFTKGPERIYRLQNGANHVSSDVARGSAFHADEHRCGADANDHFGNVAAFKKCMRTHGWVADAYKPDPPKSRADSHLAPGDDYISVDTGMSCKDLGGIGICGPPRGTVRYRNDKGENCTRTGLVSICD
jgi:hypothetical protein